MTYVVRAGNSLWKIAKRELGSGSKWGAIYEANKATIRDPTLIYLGRAFLIPTA